MFEKAARAKLRFETSRGLLSVEDLWDLPLTSARGVSLNDIAVDLNNRIKRDVVSFVDEAEVPDERLQLGFDIVIHVIAVRKEEARAAAVARVRAEQKQKVLAIIARKEDARLEEMDLDQLREMIGAL